MRDQRSRPVDTTRHAGALHETIHHRGDQLKDRNVGLVLGGGGVVGAAFHAGVLLGIQLDTGWDPRSAEVVVGTSAGALVGTLVRLGWSAEDLAALAVGAGLSRPPRRPADPHAAFAGTPSLRPSLRVRSPRGTALATALRGAPRRDFVKLASAFVPPETGPPVIPPLGRSWPQQPLWLCAVSDVTLRLTVFGMEQRPSLDEAVQASCAIPGVLTSPEIDGVHYLDGGIHSPSNADLLTDSGVDLAIISSPMTGPHWMAHPMGPMLRLAQRHLDREVRSLCDVGIDVVVVEPDRVTRRQMGYGMLSDSRRRQTVTAAILRAGRVVDATLDLPTR
jgi:NTE family protein